MTMPKAKRPDLGLTPIKLANSENLSLLGPAPISYYARLLHFKHSDLDAECEAQCSCCMRMPACPSRSYQVPMSLYPLSLIQSIRTNHPPAILQWTHHLLDCAPRARRPSISTKSSSRTGDLLWESHTYPGPHRWCIRVEREGMQNAKRHRLERHQPERQLRSMHITFRRLTLVCKSAGWVCNIMHKREYVLEHLCVWQLKQQYH